MYAQDYIRRTFEEVGMEAPAIHPHPTQAGRYQLRPVEPYNSQQLTTVSQLFADVSPYDDGAEISVPEQYPPAPAAAAPGREWLTPENTLARRLEEVLIEHQLIANVKAITDIVGSLVVKFNGATPAVPAGTKRADLAQAGCLEIKTGSPGTWVVRVSDQWRIELQAGEMLRQLQAKVNELTSRNDALKAELSASQDRISERDARIEVLRSERDQHMADALQAESDVRALESQLLDSTAKLPTEPGTTIQIYRMPLLNGSEYQPMTSLAELLDCGWQIAFETVTSADVYYARLEKRPLPHRRLFAGSTIQRRPTNYVDRTTRIQRDNAEVMEVILNTPRTPVQPMTPLGGAS